VREEFGNPAGPLGGPLVESVGVSLTSGFLSIVKVPVARKPGVLSGDNSPGDDVSRVPLKIRDVRTQRAVIGR